MSFYRQTCITQSKENDEMIWIRSTDSLEAQLNERIRHFRNTK